VSLGADSGFPTRCTARGFTDATKSDRKIRRGPRAALREEKK
jgi:hypothetical protein